MKLKTNTDALGVYLDLSDPNLLKVKLSQSQVGTLKTPAGIAYGKLSLHQNNGSLSFKSVPDGKSGIIFEMDGWPTGVKPVAKVDINIPDHLSALQMDNSIVIIRKEEYDRLNALKVAQMENG